MFGIPRRWGKHIGPGTGHRSPSEADGPNPEEIASKRDGNAPGARLAPLETGTPLIVHDGRSHAERAIAGDPQALRTLWEVNRRWLAAAILAHKPRNADLEDLLQDVALKVVKRIGEVRDPAMVRPWMRAIAINAARTAGRTRTRRLRLVKPVDADPDSASTDANPGLTSEGSMNAEEARRALDAANRLPEEYREPLMLRCVRGMSYKQIADVMGIPVTTVETRLSRARRMVREELEASGAHVARPASRESE
jgi:RNA polymerase sigma-70 factor (ECF subfamily)